MDLPRDKPYATNSEYLKALWQTRYMRDSFPSDWVIQCALETGVSLKWLTFGTGPIYENAQNDVIDIKRKKIINGQLVDASFLMFDKAFLSNNADDLEIITDGKKTYFALSNFEDIDDGLWVLEIEGKISIREIIRIPVRKIRVMGENSFECSLDDIRVVRKITGVFCDLN